MTTAPDRVTELRQQNDELRGALTRAAAYLAFQAGREAADDPTWAGHLLAAVDDVAGVLRRTA